MKRTSAFPNACLVNGMRNPERAGCRDVVYSLLSTRGLQLQLAITRRCMLIPYGIRDL